MDSYRDSGLRKLVFKPDPVLLEDQSSETSGERHNKIAELLNISCRVQHKLIKVEVTKEKRGFKIHFSSYYELQ